jgi:type 1 glutamine amidotransferase
MLFSKIRKNFIFTVLGLCLLSSPAWADDGFKPIFDGKTLNGWDGDPQFWKVEDGAITGQTTSANDLDYNTFIVWLGGDLDDFELTLEYRIMSGNSGIQYRSFPVPENGKWAYGGYQADLEAGDEFSGNMWTEHDRGILAERGQKTTVGDDHQPKVTGETGDPDELNDKINKLDWNTYRVVARGFHFTHEINGHLMVDVTDNDKAGRHRAGPLCLQLHEGPAMKVQFRNIKLKRLPMENTKKIVLVAGPGSHGYMTHAHYAGCRLLADDLNAHAPGVYATVYRNGWPTDPTAFDNADAIVMYGDGGQGHMVMPHLKEVGALAKKGVGIACLHYAVEVPKGEAGNDLLNWIGGYFETDWSVNPTWTADFKKLPDHPITRGVHPFSIHDEWYFHMRFPKDMQGVTPILTAVPPRAAFDGPDDPHGGNKYVRAEAGTPQHVAWAYERKDGGRGFGFTGGHYHYNWANNNYRKLVLNALVWVAKADVPKDGVDSPAPTLEQLEKNQDSAKPSDYKPENIKKLLDRWSKAAKPAS